MAEAEGTVEHAALLPRYPPTSPCVALTPPVRATQGDVGECVWAGIAISKGGPPKGSPPFDGGGGGI